MDKDFKSCYIERFRYVLVVYRHLLHFNTDSKIKATVKFSHSIKEMFGVCIFVNQ